MDAFGSKSQQDNHRYVFTRSFYIDMLLLTSLWALAAVLVNPLGDFPLNDDWAYGRTVAHLLATGDYRPEGWVATTFVTNAAWGALFCLPAGMSFTTLRISTLIASLLGLVGVYVLMRDQRCSRSSALITVGTIAVNPLFYPLAHTFMTDTPFISIALWSVVFFARFLVNRSITSLLVGTVLSIGATMSRDVALSIPLGFAIVFLITSGITRRTVSTAMAPLLACTIAFLALESWLIHAGALPVVWHEKTGELTYSLSNIRVLLTQVPDIAFITSLYLGTALLPVTLFANTISLLRRKEGRRLAVLAILVLATGALVHVNFGTLYGNSLSMPLIGNIVGKAGVGPLALRDTYILKLDHVQSLPESFWITVTLLGFLGAVLLIVELVWRVVQMFQKSRAGIRPEASKTVGLFLIICGAIYFAPIALVFVWDRYLIPLIFFFSAAVVLLNRDTPEALAVVKPARFAAFVLVSLVAALSIGMTHDYLAWNRLRWGALNSLTRIEHIAPADIDGGMEFNGLYLYDPSRNDVGDNNGRSWWWVTFDTYQVAFGPIAKYRAIHQYTYYRWLPPGRQELLVLRKN